MKNKFDRIAIVNTYHNKSEGGDAARLCTNGLWLLSWLRVLLSIHQRILVCWCCCKCSSLACSYSRGYSSLHILLLSLSTEDHEDSESNTCQYQKYDDDNDCNIGSIIAA